MRAIVSLANERGNYWKALDRLRESLKGKTDATFFGFTSEEQVGAPHHLDNPYSFKIHAINKVREQGFKQILWLDSSVYAISDLEPLFKLIETDGYAIQEAGFWAGDWTNDETLAYFRVSRETAKTIPMYGNAGLLGLNFYNRRAIDFFEQWQIAMNAGHFIGSWDNHRHDMSCGSLIAHRLGMKINIKGDQILQYAAPEDALNNDTIILKAQGL